MSSRSITIRWDEPRSRKTEKNLTGLQFLHAIMAGTLPNSPMSRLFGFDIVEARKGEVVIESTPGEQHYNLVGNGTHGGYACTLLDSCMGGAIQSLLPAGQAATTLELKVNMVRPITRKSGKLRCEGKAIHPGRKIATSEGRIVDSQGKLYAHGTTTMLIFALDAE